jgi:hypothetical protein
MCRWLPHAHDAHELFGLPILTLYITPGGRLFLGAVMSPSLKFYVLYNTI